MGPGIEQALRQGLLHHQQGRLDAARACYEQVLATHPQHPDALHLIGVIALQRGRWDEAIHQLRAATTAAPSKTPAWAHLAQAFDARGQRGAAAPCWRRVLELDPGHGEANAQVALWAEERNQVEQAEALARQALTSQPSHPLAALVLARCLRRKQDFAGTLAALRRVPAATRGTSLLEVEGRVLDQLGRPAEAFACFDRMNRHNRAASRANPAALPAELDRLRQFMDQTEPASWTSAPAGDGPVPAFLVGFNRSGTTLLDRMLNAHPRIQVMEEEPVIDKVRATLGPRYPGALADLSPAELRELRAVYWTAAAAHVPDRREDTLVVDKLPLNTMHVGLIHRIFPTAPIVLSVRHPADVVWSNFIQNYGDNAVTCHFHGLDSTAALYVRVMGLWQAYRAALPLRAMVLRYEDLVDDWTAATKAVLDFLGLPWDDALLAYRAKAAPDRIKTPSYHQVVQPVYRGALDRWRRYAEPLAPVLPSLAPFVSAFGYPPTDGSA